MPSLSLRITFQISSLLRRPSPVHSSSSPSSPTPASAPNGRLTASSSVSLDVSSSRSWSLSGFARHACVSVSSMTELVHDADNSSAAAAAAGDGQAEHEVEHLRTFIDAGSYEELLSGIRNLAEGGKLPPNVASGMEELFHTYKNAVFRSGIPRADEAILSNMCLALDRVLFDVEDPFVFEPYHKALRKPFDYYVFVQNYIRPLIDFRSSYVGNIDIFSEIQEKLRQGHNVVLMSNHQTEADPAVISLLLEKTHEDIAQNLIYVAGDRVLTDPLCKPFSMGRNLFCVYSKKHMLDVPELADMKRKANIRSLKEMALVLRGGSQIVWIAPSGGRDRPDPVTEEWYPAPFDPSSVDNMRRLTEHSGVPGHVYPLSLLCYDIMPPPGQVEKEIGERRVVSFSGAGLAVAPEINSSEVTANCENPEEAKEAYTCAVYDCCSSVSSPQNCNTGTERTRRLYRTRGPVTDPIRLRRVHLERQMSNSSATIFTCRSTHLKEKVPISPNTPWGLRSGTATNRHLFVFPPVSWKKLTHQVLEAVFYSVQILAD